MNTQINQNKIDIEKNKSDIGATSEEIRKLKDAVSELEFKLKGMPIIEEKYVRSIIRDELNKRGK